MFFTDMGGYYSATILGYVIIDTLLIGGQEFAIDNICAEHVDIFDDCVEFEDLALGTMYGDGINTPGEVIFTEGAVPVSVEEFFYMGGGSTFGFAEVSNGSGIGTGQAMQLSNINLLFDFTGYWTLPDLVTFQYADYGGEENLAVNGSSVFIGDMIDAAIPGYSIGVSQLGDIGDVSIGGPVESLLVGGQEFFVDNVCAHFYVGIDNPGLEAPEASATLGQNYPNPFTGSTVIPFTVKKTTQVTIAIYNQLGQEVSVLTDKVYNAGDHTLEWNSQGSADGIYFYQLRTPDFIQSRKLSVY
jgi:hypothetical protein